MLIDQLITVAALSTENGYNSLRVMISESETEMYQKAMWS